MNTCSLLALFTALALATDAAAQESKPPSPPRRSSANGPVRSPEILSDGGVTFRYRSDKASSVKVAGQPGPETALTRDDDGVWSATLPAVKPGVYEYRLIVDGVNLIDPANAADVTFYVFSANNLTGSVNAGLMFWYKRIGIGCCWKNRQLICYRMYKSFL